MLFVDVLTSLLIDAPIASFFVINNFGIAIDAIIPKITITNTSSNIENDFLLYILWILQA